MKTKSELKVVEIYRTDGDAAFSDYKTIDFVNKYQSIYLFEKTAHLVKDKVKAKLIPNQEIKGKAGPVNLYAVQSIRLPEKEQDSKI